jgi:aminomethyltransferase
MKELNKTVLYDRHLALGAEIIEFGGWQMPLHYGPGIVQEHLETRRGAGLFDVSHMGRFTVHGKEAVPFLQHVLSNNAAALELDEGHYTMIPNRNGGAIDDAYLYRFVQDEYLLVVNAANREKDWSHLTSFARRFGQMKLVDRTRDLAMFSLQGPMSKRILSNMVTSGGLPEPIRNNLSTAEVNGAKVLISRTGYTGEPLCFELFVDRNDAPMLWDLLIDGRIAQPAGLGARDTLRLEAGLPLYGRELGPDAEGNDIPIFASPLARFAVSFSPLKGEYTGKQALWKQFQALKAILDRKYDLIAELPRMIMPVALKDRGVARSGNRVYRDGKFVGYVTSGTMVPYWKTEGSGLGFQISNEKGMRAICLALIDSGLWEGDEVAVEIRGKTTQGIIVPYHLRSEAPPFAHAIPFDLIHRPDEICAARTVDEATVRSVDTLIRSSIENTLWRRQRCINLIPSEQTPSRMARMLSILDPVGRYAEHKALKAFSEAEVFYYQGTDFIAEVEELLECELRQFLGCAETETRVVSGQMANMAVLSGMVDYLNRGDRKSEQRRIRRVLNHHIIKGGHLSAQPMGALRDFVIRDPRTEKPAVVNFPVLEENPYQIDVAACRELIETYPPELIIFGKSMMLHREPVSEIRTVVEELNLDCLILYDMAHVLGLVGPHFQQPFVEGADLVTGSTHKTFFGTQRGVIASDYGREDARFELWEAIERRTFPGNLSNHHLGTLLGLLLATYEMNSFKEAYQSQVLANAKAFARALSATGLDVAGDPGVSFTETHQVIVQVGYGRGPEIARRLENNNIIVNYQAGPYDEGFTAAGALRMGVAEMTRFGMREDQFEVLAQLIHDVVAEQRGVREAVTSLRGQFFEMKFCFEGDDFKELLQRLHQLI